MSVGEVKGPFIRATSRFPQLVAQADSQRRRGMGLQSSTAGA
jgi:hypothetical protein